MRGDFSRGIAARPGVARVLMQQGRVQLDADWNEAAAAADRRARIALSDLLGSAEPFGVAAVPREAAGFEITVRNGYRFDGKRTHLYVDDVVSLGEHAEFAIEATVSPRSGGRGGTIVARFRHRQHGHPSGEFVFRLDAHGRPVFSRVERGRVRTLTATLPVAFDAHTEIAAVCDGHELALYVGGRFAGSHHVERGLHERGVELMIGAHASEHHLRDVFDGTIDALAIQACPHRHHFEGRREPACPPAIYTLDDAHRHHGDAPPERLPRRIVASAGRAYVGGILCENVKETDVASVEPVDGADGGGASLAYLEVWERLVTAVEDASLEDPALGGIDTAVRVHTEARVRVAPLERVRARLRDLGARGTMVFAPVEGVIAPGNQLVRVEVHRSGYAAEPFDFDDARLLEPASTEGNVVHVAPDPGWEIGQPLLVIVAGAEPAPAIVTSVAGNGYALSTPLPSEPFRIAPIASVKWSSDNGAIAFALPGGDTSTQRFALNDPFGRVAGLHAGDVLEIAGPAAVNEGTSGALTVLTLIDTDEPGTTAVTVADPIGPLDAGGILRVWSPFPASAAPGAPAREANVDAGKSIALTDGLAVQFGSGYFAAGDFWWTPIRVDVDDGLWGWPTDRDGKPQPMPPAGVERRFAPLALLESVGTELRVVSDLRRIFDPLADDGSDPFAQRDGHDDRPQREREPSIIVREDERRGTIEIDVEAGLHDRSSEHETVVIETLERTPREEPAIVLSRHTEPPPGYSFTGTSLQQRPLAPAWEPFGDAPSNGTALAAAIDGRLYAFFESSGELWFRDVRDRRGAWLACASRGSLREGGTLVVLGGTLYALGGLDEAGRPSASCDAYDPDRDAWDPVPPMHTARAFFGAAVAGGRIVAVGGVRQLAVLGFRFASDRVESWEPGELRWRREPPLAERRQGCAAAGCGRMLYLAGGSTGPFWARSRRHGMRIDALAPFEGRSWERGMLAKAQRDARAELVDDTLVVAGGRAPGDTFARAERFSIGAAAGEPLGEFDRIMPGLAGIDGIVYAVAGENAFGSTANVARCAVAPPLYVHQRGRTDA